MLIYDRKVYAIRVSDSMMLGSPILVVGNMNIKNIEYHCPLGEGDKHFADVYFLNGTMERFFDIVTIQFESMEEIK